MRGLADQWYSSGTFLGVAGIAAAVVFGVLGVWAAFRAANPRQELAWQVLACIPLLNDQAGAVRDVVQVRLDGKPLAYPTAMEIRLFNRGRRDIPTAAFDQGRPLRVDVGAPIVRHLSTVGNSDRFRTPRITIEGSAFTLGPDLLKKGQSITVSLLLDANTPRVTVPKPPFSDIDVRERAHDSEAGTPAMVAAKAAMMMVIVVAFAAIFMAGAARNGASWVVEVAVGAGAGVFGVVEVASLISGSFRRRKRS